MNIINKITSRQDEYKEQYHKELIDYIKNFDGTEKHYLIEQIQILEGAKFYLMSGFYQKSFEENYKHLDLKAIASAIEKENKLLPKRLRNSILGKLDFLHNKLKNFNNKMTEKKIILSMFKKIGIELLTDETKFYIIDSEIKGNVLFIPEGEKKAYYGARFYFDENDNLIDFNDYKEAFEYCKDLKESF